MMSKRRPLKNALIEVFCKQSHKSNYLLPINVDLSVLNNIRNFHYLFDTVKLPRMIDSADSFEMHCPEGEPHLVFLSEIVLYSDEVHLILEERSFVERGMRQQKFIVTPEYGNMSGYYYLFSNQETEKIAA